MLQDFSKSTVQLFLWDFLKRQVLPTVFQHLTFLGASVLIGLFKKCARTNDFSASDIFKFNPHPYRMRLEFEGLSHALPNSQPDCLVPSLCSGRSFESHLEHEKIQMPEGFFGASVLIGLFKKCAHTNAFGASNIFRFHPHPSGMRLKSEGLSHGLKSVHRTLFAPVRGLVPLFRVPSPRKKMSRPVGAAHFLVREMGLEPTRRNHTHLKRACLPFQHSRKHA